MAAKSETGGPQELFVNFPKTKFEVRRVPDLLRDAYRGHLAFLQGSHRFWEGVATKKVDILGTRFDVQRKEDTFSFYSESADRTKRKIETITADQGFNKVLKLQAVQNEPLPGQEAAERKIYTTVDLSRGFHIEQEVAPIPGLILISDNSQIFAFDSSRKEFASFSWILNREEAAGIAVTGERSLLRGQVEIDLSSGWTILATSLGGLVVPQSFDETVASTIHKAIEFKPPVFQFVRK